jgi:tRNA A-37 threonylcarbamoyl transferase component Bud32
LPTNDADSPGAFDRAVEELELAWQVDRGDLSVVCEPPELRDEHRYELALVDMEYRWRGTRPIPIIKGSAKQESLGERPTWLDYCRCWPHWFQPQTLTPALIAEAYRIQRRYGAARAKDDVLSRHSHLRADLLGLLATIDRELDADDLLTKVAASEPVRLSPAQAPLRFEDYVLEKHLGSGGMGKVYRATQRSLQRPVAIKTLKKKWHADLEATQRLVREAQLLGKLRHPGIVSVHGLGQFPAGSVFLAMDYIEGVDLHRYVAREENRLGSSRDITRSIADAVAHAHDRQVLHCDLKPSNILVDDENRIYVTDFGLGRALGASGRAESLGEGTRGYMAPEQHLPGAEVTKATDVYGIGAILFRLMFGHIPSSANLGSAQRLSADEALHQVCLQCLEEDPMNRFPDARALWEAL